MARHLLGELGFDPGLVDEAIADPTTGDEVLADHRRVVDAAGYGVPTLFFPDGQCLFGPVLIDPPAGEAAVRLWDAVVAWTEFPHLYELQRPKPPPTPLRSPKPFGLSGGPRLGFDQPRRSHPFPPAAAD